jgi:hypothetical protein
VAGRPMAQPVYLQLVNARAFQHLRRANREDSATLYIMSRARDQNWGPTYLRRLMSDCPCSGNSSVGVRWNYGNSALIARSFREFNVLSPVAGRTALGPRPRSVRPARALSRPDRRCCLTLIVVRHLCCGGHCGRTLPGPRGLAKDPQAV